MKTYETCPKTAVRGDVYYNDGSFHTGLASAILLQRAKLRVREFDIVVGVGGGGGGGGPAKVQGETLVFVNYKN